MKNVLELLEHTAGRIPNKIAAIDEHGSMSFAELLRATRAAGSYLASGRELFNKPVPVLTEKSINSLVAFFAVLYAGGYYVPMDTEQPFSSAEVRISILKPSIIICDRDRAEQAKRLLPNGDVIIIEEILDTPMNSALLSDIRSKKIDTDPVYTNFTSGSTGTPKGVVIAHRSVIEFIDEFTQIFGIDETDTLANQAPLDFDVSVKDIYSCLKTGATILLIPRRLFSAPVQLLDFICEHEVTNMTWAVSALCLISTFHGLDYKTPNKLKRVLYSGEIMPKKHLDAWMTALPDTVFVNLYGPTEITCNCCYHIIDRNRQYDNGIPIGKAFPNERIYLLSKDGEIITEPDVTGEICVSGSSVGLGYFCDFAKSDEVFIQNPANSAYHERIYKTGDLGYYNADGEIFFKGRADFQIKYMGHRLELQGLERQIEEIGSVFSCCCVFDEQAPKLFAYYTGEEEEKELRIKLRDKLPAWMIPSKIRRLPSFPLTKNGKIDRAALLLLGKRRKNDKG